MLLKYLKIKFYEILNDTRAELRIAKEKEFTAEQKAAFERLADFLADMVEKYSPLLDEIVNSPPEKETA